MAEERKRRTIVIGHKNPDTDSICSALCYARLKSQVTGNEYVPARAGHINSETRYVLDYFQAQEPEYVETVKTQVRDIEIREMKGVDRNISLKRAWNLMQEVNAVTLPAVSDNGVLEGLITVGDITKTYMNVLDSSILSRACTQYGNIVETLEGHLILGDENAYFDQGKVLIAAANPDLMEFYISPHDLVILGNRYESQLCAIEMEADCIIVCEGAGVSMTIRKLAQEHGCTVITTAYDAYTAARLINQSMPIGYFMKTDNLITFEDTDFIDEIRDVMASKRHRDFPILDREGKYKGMISRRNLLGARGKQVVLVDHNEKNQAVAGIENADILEIIDHHKLGIYQMYQEAGVAIDRQTAGLLCSAIISDTLLFRSPTCTEVDRQAAQALAPLAEIGLEEYASGMFAAGSNLKGKNDEEIFYQDFKRFSAGKISFGVSQVSSFNAGELAELKGRMLPYMESAQKTHNVDMLFFMLTNILTESTELLCVGAGAESLVFNAFHMTGDTGDDAADKKDNTVELPGVVSRKKQLIPAIMMACEA